MKVHKIGLNHGKNGKSPVRRCLLANVSTQVTGAPAIRWLSERKSGKNHGRRIPNANSSPPIWKAEKICSAPASFITTNSVRKEQYVEVVNVSVWIPIITLVVGIFLKGVFDAWMENKKTNFERESRLERRKEILLLQRIDLQRKALGELQVALADVMRSTAQLHRHDLKQHKDQGYWDREVAPENLTEKSRDSFRAVTLVKVRIGDEKLRSATSKLTLLCAGLPSRDTPEAAIKDFNASTLLYSKLNKKVGKALVALEQEEQALFE